MPTSGLPASLRAAGRLVMFSASASKPADAMLAAYGGNIRHRSMMSSYSVKKVSICNALHVVDLYRLVWMCQNDTPPSAPAQTNM